AGAAGTAVADALVAGEIRAGAKGVEQRGSRLDAQIPRTSVDHQPDSQLAGAVLLGTHGWRRWFGGGKPARCQRPHAERLEEVAPRDAAALVLVVVTHADPPMTMSWPRKSKTRTPNLDGCRALRGCN